jgi:uncharacterized membrane protein
MDDKTQQQLSELELQISQIHASVKKTERYMKVTFWSTVILFVLPMVIAALIIPVVLSKYAAMYEGLL